MGKLRSSIENVVKTAEVLEKATNVLLDERTKLMNNFMHHCEFCRGGSESIYMYLMEKYKKEGKRIEDHQKSTLKSVIDANIATMVKELVPAQARVVKHIAEGGKLLQVGNALKSNVAKLRGDITGIQAIIDKKKKKWLSSSNYKAKLKGYEVAIADLDSSLVRLDKMLPGKTFGSYVTPEVWAITTNTTVAEIKDGSSTYLTGDLKTAKQDDDDNAKTFRGRGFGKSLAVMKQWVDDADKMEAEAEEKDAEEDSGGGLNPKPKMKDVTIKKGSAVLAEGKSGDYDRKSKILVAELTWKKGIQALDFLQQKLSVTASAVNKEDGELKSDMKLDKLSGDFKKATFKG